LSKFTARKWRLQTVYGDFNFPYGVPSATIFTKWIIWQQTSSTGHVNIQYQMQMSNGSKVQDTVSVRERHTRYLPTAREREGGKKKTKEIGGETLLHVTVYVLFVYDYYE